MIKEPDVSKTDEAIILTQHNGQAAMAINVGMIDKEQFETEIANAIPVSKEVDKFIADLYLVKLFAWIILWATFLFTFIWIIDPYGVSPLQVNLPGINTFKPKRIDIDRLIKPFEVWRYQPKTIFLGTSRIHQSIDPSVFDGTDFAPAYNAAIPASTLAENEANIEQFLKLDHSIKHIFIELFLYNFIIGQSPAATKTWSKLMSNVASLQISSDALYDAVNTIVDNTKEGPIATYIAKSGYRIPSSDFNPATSFSEVSYIYNVISTDHNAKMSLQPSAIESLDRIVALAQRHGVHLHLLLTPNYPWDDYRLMSLGYWPLLEKWIRKMAAYPDVVSFSQYNRLLEEPPKLNPKMKWWNDPIHFNLNMGHAMMRAYLGHPIKATPKNFMHSVNPTTVESVIAERRIGALRWAKTHPEFVEDFEDAKKNTGIVSGTLNAPAMTLSVNGHTYPIVLGIGVIEYTTEQNNSLTACGWVVDEKAKRNVKQLIATIGSSVVAQGFTIGIQEDVSLAFDKNISGAFAMEIPLKTRRHSEPIRIFAVMKDGRAVQLTSKSPQIDGQPLTKSLGYTHNNNLIIDKKNYPIVKRISGSIERTKPIPHGYTVNGWAYDIKANKPATAVIAVSGSTIVAKGLPTINREDISKNFNHKISRSGFSMVVPLRDDEKNGKSQVRLFALMSDGVVSPLSSSFEESTSDVFKNVELPRQ